MTLLDKWTGQLFNINVSFGFFSTTPLFVNCAGKSCYYKRYIHNLFFTLATYKYLIQFLWKKKELKYKLRHSSSVLKTGRQPPSQKKDKGGGVGGWLSPLTLPSSLGTKVSAYELLVVWDTSVFSLLYDARRVKKDKRKRPN